MSPSQSLPGESGGCAREWNAQPPEAARLWDFTVDVVKRRIIKGEASWPLQCDETL
jgi:hypothetical protein